MKERRPANLTASVRQRLLNRVREKGEDFNLVLTRYGWRDYCTDWHDPSTLIGLSSKGAMLFAVWANRVYRPTKDLDLLGYGGSSKQTLAKVFQEICLIDVEPDGLVFDAISVRVRYP